jgi:hypothetical protein
MVKRITIETFETGTEGANLTYVASNSRFEWVKGDARQSFSVTAPTPVTEAGTITFTLTTTNVVDGVIVPFTLALSNTDNQANDFVSTSGDVSNATLTGNFVVSSGSNAVSLSLNEDFTTEGTETLTLTLDEYPTVSNVVSITDSSTAGGGVIGTISTTDAYFFGGYDGNPGTYGSRFPTSPGAGYGNRVSKIATSSDTQSFVANAPTSYYTGYAQSITDRPGGVGYNIGGLSGLSPQYRTNIFSFTYSSSTTATADPSIAAQVGTYGGSAFTSNNNDGGITGGGINPTSPTPYNRGFYWIPYASVTTQTFTVNHPEPGGHLAYDGNCVVSPSNKGYLLDGQSPTAPGNYTQYWKLDVASSSSMTVVASIPSPSRGSQSTKTQSSDDAYVFGGVHTDYSTPQPYPWGYKREKMPFASETTRTVTTLPTSFFHRLGSGGSSSTTAYIMGGLKVPGMPSPLYPTSGIKFPFSSETTLADVGTLTNQYVGYAASNMQD